MDASYQKAEDILRENLEKLHQIAARLMEVETMEADEFEAIMTGQPVVNQSEEGISAPDSEEDPVNQPT